jgi:hypothetical protein
MRLICVSLVVWERARARLYQDTIEDKWFFEKSHKAKTYGGKPPTPVIRNF